MCEEAGKLIAWMDNELTPDSAAQVERHLDLCEECRGRLAAYKNVSAQLDEYCDNTLVSSERPAERAWTPLAQSAIGAAALLAIVLVWAWPRTRIEPPNHIPAMVQSAAAVPAVQPTEVSPLVRTMHRHQARSAMRPAALAAEARPALAESPASPAPPAERMIRISIPAEEIFPAGAVPPGMNFYADLTIGPDGSAERLQLHPRLASFERSTSLP